jgi:transcriptional regulator with XRE-family HTH domain
MVGMKADWLKTRREQLQISQEELSNRLQALGINTSRATVSHWETDRYNIPLDNAEFRQALATVLRLSIVDLLIAAGFEIQSKKDFYVDLVNMVYLMMGILGARSVQTGRLAAYIPLRVKKMSIVRRMERFLDNGAVRVRAWYEPIARWLVTAAGVSGEVALVLDSTKVSAHHRLVMVGIAYHRRVVPLAWSWVCSSRGHASTKLQVALLSYVRSLIAPELRVCAACR